MNIVRPILCVCIGSVFSASATAATTQFSDRNLWEAALTIGFVTENFNSVTPAALPGTGTTAVGLLSIETINAGSPHINDGTGNRNIDGSNYFYALFDSSPVVKSGAIIFPNEVTAWGMDFNQISDQTHVTFADVTETPVGPHNSSGFIGFISDTPFTRVELTDPFTSFSAIGIDNVSFAPLSGDLDGDGFVGITDLNIVLSNWNQNVPPANPAADPSGDNFIGIEDLNIVLGNWNAGTPPPGDTANIPEPGGLGILGILGLLTVRSRRTTQPA